MYTGNIRRFRRICEHIQSQVCSKRFPGPSSPPTVASVTQAVSESSSCGSVSSERLSYKRQVVSFTVYIFLKSARQLNRVNRNHKSNLIKLMTVLCRLKMIWKMIQYFRTNREVDVGLPRRITTMLMLWMYLAVQLQCVQSK